MANMPKYAKLQNLIRRGAIKREKKLAIFLNSPLGLWLLSAVFLTIGGAGLSSRQECVAAAKSDIERFQHLTTEIMGRRLRLIEAIEDSSTAKKFVKVAKSTAFADFKDFDGQSLYSLLDQQRRIRDRITFIKDPRLRTRAVLDKLPSAIGDILVRGENELCRYVKDKDIKDLGRNTTTLRAAFVYERADDEGSLILPNCSPWRLITRLFVANEKTAFQSSIELMQ